MVVSAVKGYRGLEWLPEPVWAPSNADYHASSEWGSSMVACFRRSPALAWHYYVAKDLKPDEPSPAMILGTLVHGMILEPDAIKLVTIVIHAKSRAAKLYKEAKADWAGKFIVLEEEMNKAQAIAASILSPRTEAGEIAKAIFSRGAPEYSFRWEDSFGVPCKCRFDWLTETKEGMPCAVNLKTTRDPSTEGFRRHSWQLDYPAQQAFYVRGFGELTGVPAAVLLVTVRNDAPYEVSIKAPSPTWLELGAEVVEEDLRRLAQHLNHTTRKAWSADWERGIEPLEPPEWAMAQFRRRFGAFVQSTF